VSAQEVVVVDFVQAKKRVPAGWELKESEGKADLDLVPDGGSQALKLRSRSASFSLNRELEVDLKQTPYVEWQWKVTELPKGGDFRESSSNDQAAQLLVVFHWSLFKKQVIAYVWDTTAPKGTKADDPSSSGVPFLTIKTVVVESGDAEKGKWITETRNVVEDYKALFGDEPEKVEAIRIQINSQHTESQAESYWRSVRFKAHP
ncbi:MAG: DUF3047 domain-containing protein, partial [Candidatus Methylomirabilales bacterium]